MIAEGWKTYLSYEGNLSPVHHFYQILIDPERVHDRTPSQKERKYAFISVRGITHLHGKGCGYRKEWNFWAIIVINYNVFYYIPWFCKMQKYCFKCIILQLSFCSVIMEKSTNNFITLLFFIMKNMSKSVNANISRTWIAPEISHS
jgi:hypothetical protein